MFSGERPEKGSQQKIAPNGRRHADTIQNRVGIEEIGHRHNRWNVDMIQSGQLNLFRSG